MNLIRIAKKVAGPVALLAALSLGMTIVTASPAAAIPRCNLSITSADTPDDHPLRLYKLEVTCGLLAYTRWDAYADDGTQGTQYLFSSSQPEALADASTLDEDFNDSDEIFADVVYKTSSGWYLTVRTNTVHGDFS
ncbi:hypothetical protein Aph01nite_80440 [Acrocarpospora phusangensis]|uniref:Uncharacterized protein n=1 Tax=Acrocarpospora phusangensis TaxID=1070424 RepID=A0A919UQF4_9ACTN|nr:hypothetical protein [Acrocarpospora phusangensis]GIH29734.1 hypothetical protein Aph01nite_80440 [Acrocarpospora phusangensis]